MYHMSGVICHISHVTFPLSPILTAIATNPSLANSPAIHRRLVHQHRTNNFFQKHLMPTSGIIYNFVVVFNLISYSAVFKKEGSFIKNSNHIAKQLGFYLNHSPTGTS